MSDRVTPRGMLDLEWTSTIPDLGQDSPSHRRMHAKLMKRDGLAPRSHLRPGLAVSLDDRIESRSCLREGPVKQVHFDAELGQAHQLLVVDGRSPDMVRRDGTA